MIAKWLPSIFRRSRKTRRASAGEAQAYAAHYNRNIRAKYDAAQTTPEMESWWSQADSRSPDASTDRAVRQRIRDRARYECYQSGSIAEGMVEALVNEVIEYGPSIEVQVGNKKQNKLIEAEFAAWAKEIKLGCKLRTHFRAKVVDGESFAERLYNPVLSTPVKVDLRLTEADYWTDLLFEFNSPQETDGITYDVSGNPVSYMRLKTHPGSEGIAWNRSPFETDVIPAQNVIHWFKSQRPDQRRGVSEMASSLKPLAQLRRYQLAVQAAAETAANHAGVMFSTVTAFSEAPRPVADEDIFMLVPTSRNGLTTLPEGWDMRQLKAEQPTTSYVEFVEERIAAAARPLQMPLNIAMGSSKNHNFASAKLDRMQFQKYIRPVRRECEDVVLSKVFQWWFWEARRIPDYLPNFLPEHITHFWKWPKSDPVDVESQAKADEVYFNLGWKTDAQYFVENSIDEEEHYDQLARQTAAREKFGEHFPQPGVRKSESITPQSRESRVA